MTFKGPGGYPRDALSLPIYGLTADDCRWIPLIIGVRKRTKATSRTMQKSDIDLVAEPLAVKLHLLDREKTFRFRKLYDGLL